MFKVRKLPFKHFDAIRYYLFRLLKTPNALKSF